jgi:predicted CXXCH cytochrome family protein
MTQQGFAEPRPQEAVLTFWLPQATLALLLSLTFCFAADSNEPRYAGADVCSSCHRDIAASQTTTAMAKTWHGVMTASLPLNYDGRAKEGSEKVLEYEIRRQSDRFVYSTVMPDKSKVTLPVKVLMGGERNGLSFLVSIDALGGIPLERPALIEARYCYNTPHHTLALSPGFLPETPRSYETAFGRVLSHTFEVKCLTCHGQPNTLGAGKQGGVRCESCHGPGLQHVQAVGQGKPGTGITNPKKLTSEQSLEICGQCHTGFSYQSDPLPKELLVSSQVPALRNAESFVQSGGALTCTRCHDPHRDASHADTEKVSVNACLGCHSAELQHRAAICPVNASDKCIGCHMPSVSVGAFHTTDHWIRVHPEQGIEPPQHNEGLRSQVQPLREFLRVIVTDDGAKAETASRRLANGEGFFDVARDLSGDATAPGGGYVGEMWLAQMDPKLRVAAAKLAYRETSGIIDMGNRWIILQRMPRDFKLVCELSGPIHT